MKIIKRKIDLYGDGIGSVAYVQHVGNDKMIVNAARVSFGQENDEPLSDKDKKLIKYLLKHNHSSPFEHNSITFKVKVPLYVRSQHHRHRTFAYNEISRRYTDDNIEFYEPDAYRTQHKSNRQASNELDTQNPKISGVYFVGTPDTITVTEAVEAHRKLSVQLFEKMLKSGVCREQARGVLPQNLYTEYYATVSLHNLFRFIRLRTHEGAQWEIQQVANAFVEIAETVWPETMKLWRENG